MKMSKVPRRMQRFYRQTNQPSQNNAYSKDNYYSRSDPFSKDGPGLPSMEYEDVDMDEKNYQEMKKLEKLNLEEKLALLEVKKFKKEKKRLPNKKESEQMADNLFTQFKNNPQNGETSNNPRTSRRDRKVRAPRTKRGKGKQETTMDPFAQNMPQVENPNNNIKDLFAGAGSTSGAETKNEFDLGLDLESSDASTDMGSMDDLKSISGGENSCSNCGKENNKTIFCPKCGTAFCEHCSTEKNELGYTCPKCKTKVKA
jgi:hypothetical protein